jgi:hypothetical protein
VALLTFPLMAGVQEICDRTALATGKGLGELLVVRFGRAWRVVVGLLIGALIVANALNIAADLVAVGAGMHLLHASPTAPWAVLAGIIIMVLLVSGSFATIARVFKVLVPRSSRTLRCYFSCADSTSGVDHPPRPRLLTMSDAQNARRTDRAHRALQMPATTDFDGCR